MAAVLAVVLSIVFAPFLFGKLSLMSSAGDVPSMYGTGAKPPEEAQPFSHLRALDAAAPAWTTEPWLALEHRMIADRQLPWWDPYDGYGQPFAASMQPQPFYPLTALLALHPSPRGYALWIVVRLFLAGWFAALFLRLFVALEPAIVGGAATMLTGYYLLYYDMPHLSVDVTLPMLLWATELVVRRPAAPARIAALAGAAGLAYLGGMPESAMLVLTMALLYGIVRLITTPLRGQAALALIGSNLLGLGLGCASVLPFAAYVGGSFNIHDPAHIGGAYRGLERDVGWPTLLLTELVPRAFGSVWGSILTGGSGHSGVRGFFGCAAFLLAVIAVITAARRRGLTTAPIAFFAVAATFFVLKRFGNPLVAWTGSLPLFRLIEFTKYEEATLGVSVALLAGFGCAALWSRRADVRTVLLALGVAFLVLVALVVHAIPLLPSGVLAGQFYVALVPAFAALLVAAIGSYALVARDASGLRDGAFVLILGAIVAEPFFGYLQPTITAGAPPVSENPYTGAPYLTWLDANVKRDRERIFGIGGILFPNWSGAFGFADPRSLNAIYPADYLAFVDAFITSTPATSDDQFDRFVATRPVLLRAPLVDRWLELSSIGYIIQSSGDDVVDSPPGGFVDALWQGVEAEVPDADRPYVHPTTVSIDGVTENALFEHAPHAVHYSVVVPRNRPVLVADVGVDPRAYTNASCGGPITFALDALNANGQLVRTLHSTLDPYDSAGDRHWRAVALDLSAERGQGVVLNFATTSVKGCSAWAVWGEPRFTVAADRHPISTPHVRFALAYTSPDAVIYRVPNALPRLSLFHRATSASGLTGALSLLTAAAFDVHREVVVDGAIPPLGASSAGDRVTVLASHTGDVLADVTADSPALLMQNDTWLAGWVARVDGRAVPVLRVDGIFRGIPVPAGHHTIEIAYRAAPDTIGLIISSIALLIVVALLVLGGTRARRASRVQASSR